MGVEVGVEVGVEAGAVVSSVYSDEGCGDADAVDKSGVLVWVNWLQLVREAVAPMTKAMANGYLPISRIQLMRTDSP